jgi:hypothetical protein
MEQKIQRKRRLIKGVFALFWTVVIGAVVFPVFAKAKSGRGDACLSNLKQLAAAQAMYALDWDGRLPPANAWMDAIEPLPKSKDIFYNPRVRPRSPDAYGYAMNIYCSGIDVNKEADPSGTVLLFESLLLARNACSGFYGLPDPPRNGEANCVAFLDGSVANLTAVKAEEYGPDGRKKK